MLQSHFLPELGEHIKKSEFEHHENGINLWIIAKKKKQKNKRRNLYFDKCRFHWIYFEIYFYVVSFSNPNRKLCFQNIQSHRTCKLCNYFIIWYIIMLCNCNIVHLFVNMFMHCTHTHAKSDTVIIILGTYFTFMHRKIQNIFQ